MAGNAELRSIIGLSKVWQGEMDLGTIRTLLRIKARGVLAEKSREQTNKSDQPNKVDQKQ